MIVLYLTLSKASMMSPRSASDGARNV